MTATRRPRVEDVGPSGVLCEGCEEMKPASAFYVRGDSGRVRSRCKSCEKRVFREKYAADPQRRQRAVERAAAWQKAHPERDRELRRRHRRKRDLRDKYGLTVADWDALLIAQAGRCAICREPMRIPCVDHCHQQGHNRGLLCKDCNTGLGHFRDDVRLLRAAIDYLSAAPV